MITVMIGISTIVLINSLGSSDAVETPIYSGSCGDSVTFEFDPSTGELTISGSGPMKNYNDVERPWYSYKESIKSVNIGTSVTSIGYYAFSGCTTLTSVTIPNSVTKIWYAAFRDCTALTSIEIPDSITELQRSTFDGCINLISITIPNTVTKIGSSVFRGCTALTSIEIPDSVTYLGSAFYDCTSLNSVTIPDSVTTIEYRAFYNCSSLKSISVGEGNEKFCSAGGVLFNKAMTELIQYPIGKLNTIYRVPDTVKDVDGSAFSNCTTLNYVILPDSVKTLGYYVFSDCIALKSIVIPDSVTTIRGYAFDGCTSLSSIYTSDSVTSIGSGAFNGKFYDTDTKTELESTATNLCGSAFKNTNGKWIKQDSDNYISPSPPSSDNSGSGSERIYLFVAFIFIISVLLALAFYKKRAASNTLFES